MLIAVVVGHKEKKHELRRRVEEPFNQSIVFQIQRKINFKMLCIILAFTG